MLTRETRIRQHKTARRSKCHETPTEILWMGTRLLDTLDVMENMYGPLCPLEKRSAHNRPPKLWMLIERYPRPPHSKISKVVQVSEPQVWLQRYSALRPCLPRQPTAVLCFRPMRLYYQCSQFLTVEWRRVKPRDSTRIRVWTSGSSTGAN